MFVGEVAGLLAAACWAGTTLLVRGLSGRMSVVSINVWRAGTAGLLALIAATLVDPGAFGRVSTWALGLIVVSVVCGPGLGDTIYFASLRMIGVARAMPISGTNPLFAALLSVIWLGEEVTPKLAVGIALVVLSVSLVAAGRGASDRPRDTRLGIALALGAAVLWATATVTVRPVLREFELLAVNGIRIPLTALAVTAYAWRSGQVRGPRTLRRRDIGVLILIGAITSFSTVMFLTSVQFAGVARASALSSTAPIFGAPIARIVYGETLTARVIAGILLSVAGIVLLTG